MKVIGTGELQALIPTLYKVVDEEYLIVNTKTKNIVGAIRVLEPPEEYIVESKYEIVFKKKKGK